MPGFDLEALEQQAAAESFDFTYRGTTFTLPGDCPLAVLKAARKALRYDDGDDQPDVDEGIEIMEDFVRAALGPEQFATFEALSPSTKAIIALAEELGRRWGVSTGESEASQPSLNVAGEPSRPTSPATTTSTSRKRSSVAS